MPVAEASVPVALFRSNKDNTPAPAVWSWGQLGKRLSEHAQRKAKDGPAFSPVRYKEGAKRGNDGVIEVACYVADLDDGTHPDDLRARWVNAEGQPLAFSLYSTHSSTAEHPKWRVVFLLAAPVPADEWLPVWRKCSDALTDGRCDPATKDPARISYLPACPPDRLSEAFAEARDGAALAPGDYPDPPQEDLADRMAATMRRKEARAGGPTKEGGGGRAGDDFSHKATVDDVAELLEGMGWREFRRRGHCVYMTRPGKPSDVSGVVGYPGDPTPTFHCFTSSTDFDVRSYNPFAVLAAAKHGGDFAATARALGKNGYGEPAAAVLAQKVRGRAEASSGKFAAPPEALPPQGNPGSGTEDAPPPEFEMTDLGNAERLIARHGRDMRYCPTYGWIIWDEKRWVQDESGEAERRLFDTIRAIDSEAAALLERAARLGPGEDNKQKGERLRERATALIGWRKKSEAAPRLAGALALAQKLPGVYVAHSDLDADLWLFNVPNGTIDLKTGELRKHRREDLITLMGPVPFDPSAACPVWLKALERWQPDIAVQTFLRRAAGYSLTGDTGEETAFLLYGLGRNGKSKFTAALEYIMGGYAGRAPIEIFMASGRKESTGPTPDKAELAGKRLVIASEIKEARRFDEAFIKDVTGGDPITATPKFKKPFTFKPALKLWLYGNHRPVIKGTDDGIKARLPLIPFTVTIPKEDRDKHLVEKLQSEAAGILAWAVRGCLEWQERGLDLPPAVLTASDLYYAEMDVLSGFFDTECVFTEGAWTSTSSLRTTLDRWAESEGVGRVSPNELADRLTRRGCKAQSRKLAQKNVRGWVGVGMVSDVQDPSATPVTPGYTDSGKFAHVALDLDELPESGVAGCDRCSQDDSSHDSVRDSDSLERNKREDSREEKEREIEVEI